MKIIVFKEKHYDRYFDASTNQKLYKACLKILKERVEDDYLYEGDYLENAKQTLSSGNGKLALIFLEGRAAWEYEGFEIEDLEEV